jgi:hypothetical protein
MRGKSKAAMHHLSAHPLHANVAGVGWTQRVYHLFSSLHFLVPAHAYVASNFSHAVWAYLCGSVSIRTK